MYNHELKLIKERYVSDELKNQIPIDEIQIVLCKKKSITRSEFYGAAAFGLKPACIFVIHSFEYDNQQIVKFENKRYKVIKTYDLSDEEIELTVEKV